jgi:hypothetical protein
MGNLKLSEKNVYKGNTADFKVHYSNHHATVHLIFAEKISTNVQRKKNKSFKSAIIWNMEKIDDFFHLCK